MDNSIVLLSAHQPVYLPWLGLLHKVIVSDCFVIFDSVPYSRKMYYNRNKILTASGPKWLSVPVLFSQKHTINHVDVRIDNSTAWKRKHWMTIQAAYAKAPFFEAYAPRFEKIYNMDWDKLSELNQEILQQLMDLFGIKTPIKFSSQMALTGNKSDLVLDMCVQQGAYAYLFGKLGRDYAEVNTFLKSGVAPLFQDYIHPSYDQRPQAEFVPFMSALDLLFNKGGEEGRSIIESHNFNRSDYLRAAEAMKSEYRSQ